MLQRFLPTILVLVLALAPAAGASPRAHSAAAERAEASLEAAEAVLIEGERVRTGREATHVLREVAAGLRHLRGPERKRAVALLTRPTDADAPDDERYTVPELPPLCDDTFCIHSVGSGLDVPSLGMAALTLVEANRVHDFANGTLGWNAPPDDGDGRVDIYLKELGENSLFGFASTDPGQDDLSQHSYLVIDNDFDPDQYGGAPSLESLRVTLAHEYAHALQYGYDVTADGWHYESSAVWMEQRMYPEIKDWLRFLNDRSSGRGWRSLTELPLTAFDHADDEPRNAKPYGSAVWNHFLSSRYGGAGDGVQLGSWERSNGLDAPSTAAFDGAIRAAGGGGLPSDFASFSAAVAEWRIPSSPFPDANALPDVERRGTITPDGATVSASMDHLTFAFYDVPVTDAPEIRLAALFPEGVHGALALVARRGSATGGVVTTRILELPEGGAGGVTLDQPGIAAAGGRITAVLVNADAAEAGYSSNAGDWRWLADGERVSARISSDASGPVISSSSPGPDASGVSTRTPIQIVFSQPVLGVDESTFVLRNPRGRRVPASVTYVNGTRTAILTPASPLHDTTRYRVRVGGSILSAAAVRLPQTDWTFTTVRRPPLATLRVQNGRLRLRSRDRDRLKWVAKLRQSGRTIGRRSGAIRPGRTRTLAVRGGRAGPARVVVVLTDPQGNRKRLRRAVRLLP